MLWFGCMAGQLQHVHQACNMFTVISCIIKHASVLMQEKKHANMGHDQDHEMQSFSGTTGDWKLHDSWLAVAMRSKLARRHAKPLQS